MTEELDPLSSEAMYVKHKEAVEAQHKAVKKKKKKKEDDVVVFYRGKFTLCYNWGEEDTLLTNQNDVKDPQ